MSDRKPRMTSSASYAALSEPTRASNGKLLSLCVVLGAMAIGVVVLKDAVPAHGPAPKQVAKASTTPAPATAADPAPSAPSRPRRWAPPPKLPSRPASDLSIGDTARSAPPQPVAEAPAPAAPAEPEPPVENVPGPAPQTPDATPEPAPAPGVSDAPEVAPEAASPLDEPKTTPTPAPTKPAAEKIRPGEVVERFDDGTIKARYMTNSKGQKNGSYLELHHGGKPRIKATYKAGLLDGTLTEASPQGKVVRRASYKAGQLHGEQILADASGKAIAHETWFHGKLLYPKSQDDIVRKLAEIASEPLAGPAGEPKFKDFEPFAASSQIKALRRLRGYRYLCDVPYDVTLNRQYGELCTAASQLLQIIGHLDHHPEKPPGVPDSLYVPALQGLAEGNLHEHSERRGETLLMGGVDMWIFDSDKHNIAQVGHRRWSLNPRMKEVAWGVRDRFTVMYSHDQGRSDAHARDFVAYPSRGYFPISWLVKDSAWSCAFDQDRYRLLDSAKVVVCPADARLRKGEPVELHDVTVENKIGYGGGNAMIFRPEVTVAQGARYWVTITGVTDLEGKPADVEYLVEFCRG